MFNKWISDGTLDKILERAFRRSHGVGRNRRRVVVHRRHDCACFTRCGGGGSKGAPCEPADHALGRFSRQFSHEELQSAVRWPRTSAALSFDGWPRPRSTALLSLLPGADAAIADGMGEPMPGRGHWHSDKGYRTEWIDNTLLATGI